MRLRWLTTQNRVSKPPVSVLMFRPNNECMWYLCLQPFCPYLLFCIHNKKGLTDRFFIFCSDEATREEELRKKKADKRWRRDRLLDRPVRLDTEMIGRESTSWEERCVWYLGQNGREIRGGREEKEWEWFEWNQLCRWRIRREEEKFAHLQTPSHNLISSFARLEQAKRRDLEKNAAQSRESSHSPGRTIIITSFIIITMWLLAPGFFCRFFAIIRSSEHLFQPFGAGSSIVICVPQHTSWWAGG